MKNTVLTLVVLLLIAVGAYYLYQNNRTMDTTTPIVVEVTDDEAMDEEGLVEDSITVTIAAQDPAVLDQDGEAVITATDTGVRVELTLNALDEATAQPAHIHVGECPLPGDVAFNLESVVNGMSTTLLDVTMDELEAMLPLAINVHRSAEESSVYTACGDILF